VSRVPGVVERSLARDQSHLAQLTRKTSTVRRSAAIATEPKSAGSAKGAAPRLGQALFQQAKLQARLECPGALRWPAALSTVTGQAILS
jgi:hypothetical protein